MHGQEEGVGVNVQDGACGQVGLHIDLSVLCVERAHKSKADGWCVRRFGLDTPDCAGPMAVGESVSIRY